MKNIEYYKEKYFEKNPNSLIKILSKEGRFIYFETEFGLCKQPTDTFLLSKHLRTLSCAVNKNDYLSKIINKLYNSNYDCSLIDYKGTNNTVTLICKKHGLFNKQLKKLIYCNQGCPKCGTESKIKNKTYSNEKFINKAVQIHGLLYDYSFIEYSLNCNKIDIICKIHGKFTQTPNKHLQGRGCPKCKIDKLKILNRENPTGWNLKKWVEKANKSKNFDSFKLYVLECWDEEEKFYKIGRTFNKINNRFKSKEALPYNYKIIHIITGTAKEIFELETKMKKENKKYKYVPKIKFDGMQECYAELVKIFNHCQTLLK